MDGGCVDVLSVSHPMLEMSFPLVGGIGTVDYIPS